MKLRFLTVLVLFSVSAVAQEKGFKIIEKPAEKRIDILYNDRLMTAYRYDDSIMKPVLFPVNTVSGITITRGYPLEPRAGERTDHPHHVGLWLNYESVNGLDFWNHSTAIEPARRPHYGTIFHKRVESKQAGENRAELVVHTEWKNQTGVLQLREKTQFIFTVTGSRLEIDRTTTLTAADTKVIFKDVKDGMLAIRVARELEQPSGEASEYIDASGRVTKVDQMPAEGITGLYTSSEGIKGDSVWSSRGRWVMLNGNIRKQPITVAMIDHPHNPGYPTYWHARGYGLFALNPLGAAVFSNGQNRMDIELVPGQSIHFKYRIIIQEGKALTAGEMNTLADQFAN
ncbi:PmoA family protein [Flavihumibacter stibioxidans]|uniref:Methane oxygenase PmoA n=1 Tax=Flavihumibacter stibioxidans TaxID=1834163 RepID=A0ABR7M3M4_9BACT|nr:PmoA family protein [Flavihumibacter stibioxidans]MBC6489572.1 hypothetical protein [Flavihumibacter stibioxidans]